VRRSSIYGLCAFAHPARCYRSTRLGQATTTSICMLPVHSRGRLRPIPFPSTHCPTFP
jgi:hypothetical protein